MKKLTSCLTVLLGLLFSTTGCSDDPAEAVPIAPILKNVTMPTESQAIPGTTIRIQGIGFDPSDALSFKSLSGEPNFEALPKTVDDHGIDIEIPDNAAGPYEVSVTRAKLTAVLPVQLKVPYLVIIEDLVLPSGNFAAGAEIAIEGKGFEDGDKVEFISSAYPAGVLFSQTVTRTEQGISITVPTGAYGPNSLVIRRANKQNTLGVVNVAVSVGDVLGGGVVYYVSDGGIHGLIVKKSDVGTSTQQWGPTAEHGGTKKDIYSGKENTRLCVKRMVDFHKQFENWPLEKKSAAELCDLAVEVVDGVTYEDWFLPSHQELIELFKVKALVDQKGATITGNNYWTSTEGDKASDSPVWSAYYVNFYESTNLVTDISDKEGWKIAIRPVRQF